MEKYITDKIADTKPWYNLWNEQKHQHLPELVSRKAQLVIMMVPKACPCQTVKLTQTCWVDPTYNLVIQNDLYVWGSCRAAQGLSYTLHLKKIVISNKKQTTLFPKLKLMKSKYKKTLQNFINV